MCVLRETFRQADFPVILADILIPQSFRDLQKEAKVDARLPIKPDQYDEESKILREVRQVRESLFSSEKLTTRNALHGKNSPANGHIPSTPHNRHNYQERLENTPFVVNYRLKYTVRFKLRKEFH